jgi:hypothetical protein
VRENSDNTRAREVGTTYQRAPESRFTSRSGWVVENSAGGRLSEPPETKMSVSRCGESTCLTYVYGGSLLLGRITGVHGLMGFVGNP